MRQSVINSTLRSAAAGYRKLFLAILNARPVRDEDAEKILNLRKTVAPTGEPVHIFEDACLVETLTAAVQDKTRLDRLLKDYREFCGMAEEIVEGLKAQRQAELERQREWARQAQAAEEERQRRLRWEETHVNSHWGHIRNKFDFIQTLCDIFDEDDVKPIFIEKGFYLWSDDKIRAERFEIEATVWIAKQTKYEHPTVIQAIEEREQMFVWARNHKENEKVKQAFHLIYKAFENPETYKKFGNNPLDAGINFIREYDDWDDFQWYCQLKYTDPAERLLQEAYAEAQN